MFDLLRAFLIRWALSLLRSQLEDSMMAEPDRSLSHQVDALLLLEDSLR
jgi:hypothetical protein